MEMVRLPELEAAMKTASRTARIRGPAPSKIARQKSPVRAKAATLQDPREPITRTGEARIVTLRDPWKRLDH